VKIISPKEVSGIFSDSVKKSFNFLYPIFRVYKLADKTGQYYCVFAESRDSIGTQKDTFNRNIQAILFRIGNPSLQKVWELNDHVSKELSEETIWFWTKYSRFDDLDHDSIVDPIIVYGTSGLDGSDDSRVKILIYFKGKKIAIRHQNSTLDEGRGTEIDKSFYDLPKVIQDSVIHTMQLLEKNQLTIFPNDWQVGMSKKKTSISESHH